MGLLDDAIRDHLDLKRRRGADPAEVERAERDALGPVRRVPVEPAEGELRLGPPAFENEYEAEAAEWQEEFEPVDEGDDPPDPEPYEAAAPPRETEPVAAAPTELLAPEQLTPEPPASHPPADESEPDEEPAEVVEPRRRRGLFRRSEQPGDATVEYDVEHALKSEDADGDNEEDVLEETPEFLQDTPDHDRLWFEQKPPKDFDFDG